MPHSKLHSLYTLSVWVRHTGRQFYECCRSVSFSPLSEGKQRSYHLFWWPLADKNGVAAVIHLWITINSVGWTDRTDRTDRTIQPALHVLNSQSFKLPGRLLVSFLACDFYFYILLQPYYGMLPTLPSSNKTRVYLLPPLDVNAPNWCELSKDG